MTGLRATVERQPDGVALVADGVRVTYRDLDGRVSRMEAGFRAQGLARGDRVALLLPNGIDLVVALLASWRAGAVSVALHPQTREARLRHVLDDARPTVLVTQTSLASEWEPALQASPSVKAACVRGAGPGQERVIDLETLESTTSTGSSEAPELLPGDLAAILYTSGSTGLPKGVVHTHASLGCAIESIQAYLELQASDVVVSALPLSFGYGLTQLLLCLRVGAPLVLESFTYPARVLDVLQREGATVFAGVPTMFATLLGQSGLVRADLRTLRILTSAGSTLPEALVPEIQRAFPEARLFVMYGQTECIRVTFLPPDELGRRPGSVGRGMAGQTLWLEGPDGTRLPWGSTGELVVAGAHVMQRYWQLPEETSRVLVPGEVPGERVLRTHDIFRSDAEGFLYFVSRTDDIIKTRGEKVAPQAVEDVLCALPSVREAAVLGWPDPLLGEAVVAFVVLAAGQVVSEREMIRHCQAHLESYMTPKYIRTLSELPRNANGKVDKQTLRHQK